MMHALLVLVIALAAPALALASPRDRLGYEREIDSNKFNLLSERQDFILSDNYLASQKNRGKLITKPRADELVAAENLTLESNVLSIVSPSNRQRAVNSEVSPPLVRERRGYNLENVRVPARYPYLPVPKYNRFRRWG